MGKKKLLVGTDFTPVSETAIRHAIAAARLMGAEIHLLHILTNEESRKEAEEKLLVQRDFIKTEAPHIDVEICARHGSLFEDITEYGQENHCFLTFLGTHGSKGFQKITGLRALKVFKSSHVPFIIVNKDSREPHGFKHLVLPITMQVQTKQKLRHAAVLAEHFNCEIHLIGEGEKDEDFGKQVKLNLKYAQRFLNERKIGYTSQISDSTGNRYVKDIVNLAVEKKADLILIMNMSDPGIFNIFGSHFEQDLIANKENIPVMLVNPADNTVLSGPVSG